MAEFQWWLLLVGLVAGGGLVAVVFLDGSRREQDIEADEVPAEAQWIAGRLRTSGRTVAPDDVEAVLREHREYRNLPPPDRFEPLEAVAARQDGLAGRTRAAPAIAEAFAEPPAREGDAAEVVETRDPG